MPKLPRKYYEYEKVYEILLKYQKFEFVIELLVEPKEGGTLCHIYPSTKGRKIYRVITDVFSDKPNITTRLDTKKKPEAIMANCFRLDKVCFSDNLTGSDFKNIMNVFRIW